MLTLSCDEVSEGIFVGTYPQTPEDVKHIKEKLGATAVLCLQDDNDFRALGIRWDLLERAYAAEGIKAVHEPVEDFSRRQLLRRLPDIVETLRKLIEGGHVVYLHCTAGLNRSPTVAIAYLVRHAGMSVVEATEQVTTARECFPYEDVLARLASLRKTG